MTQPQFLTPKWKKQEEQETVRDFLKNARFNDLWESDTRTPTAQFKPYEGQFDREAPKWMKEPPIETATVTGQTPYNLEELRNPSIEEMLSWEAPKGYQDVNRAVTGFFSARPQVGNVTLPSISEVSGLALILYTGYQGGKYLWDKYGSFNQLPEYKNLVNEAKARGVSQSSSEFQNMKGTLRNAFNLYKAGERETATAYMENWANEWNRRFPGTFQPQGQRLALGTRPIPTATQTGAMQMGGKSAFPLPPEEPIQPNLQPLANLTPEITRQLKELGWTDDLIQSFDQAEVDSIIRNQQKPTLFQPTTPTEATDTTILYHGTKADYPAGEISTGKRMYGIHLTPEKSTAEKYGEVRQYGLSKDAKILNLSDGYDLWNFMIKNEILDEEDIANVDLERYVTGGELYQYDISSKTYFADDVAKTAKELGYDVVTMPDNLGDETNIAYVVVNPKVLQPSTTPTETYTEEGLRRAREFAETSEGQEMARAIRGETQVTPAVAPEITPEYKQAVDNYNTALARISMGDNPPPPPPTPEPIAQAVPALSKLLDKIKEAELVLPEQKMITHEERVKRIQDALPELGTGEGQEPFIRFMSKLQGEIPKADFNPVADELTTTEWDEIYELARTSADLKGYDYARLASGLNKIKQGQLPIESELEILRKVYGSSFTDALVAKMPMSKAKILLDLLNSPRTVLASFDLSGLLRQGGIITARMPLQAAQTIAPMIKAAYSDKNAELIDSIIKERPNWALGQEMGLYTAPLPGVGYSNLTSREEAFMSELVDKIPILGQVIKGSNRAYVTVLNDLRSRYWESIAPKWIESGASENDLRQLARFINATSGRGDLPRFLQGSAPVLNTMLFSPRLLVSRPQVIAALGSSSKRVRLEALRTILQGLGIGISILGLAKLAGASIEEDPRSADFGKIRVGNTRLDIWTGYLQWIRFLAQVGTGQRKNTETGEIYQINREDALINFVQSKSSPPAGLLSDILAGKDYAGNPVPPETPEQWSDQAWNRLVPLFIQDMVDAYNIDSWQGLGVTWPAFFGVGAMTYEPRYGKQKPQYFYNEENTPTENPQFKIDRDALKKYIK